MGESVKYSTLNLPEAHSQPTFSAPAPVAFGGPGFSSAVPQTQVSAPCPGLSASTANLATTQDLGLSSAAPSPPPMVLAPSQAPTTSTGPLVHKNRLQEYTQKYGIPLPIYRTVNEGFPQPKFKSTVLVDGVSYTSPNIFLNRKAAEQDAAKLALESIQERMKDEGCPLITHEGAVFCKSILNEFAVKMNLEMPTYNTIQSEAKLPVFVSTVVFNGVSYVGNARRNKKEAEQWAALAAILSLLGESGSGIILSDIVKSKAKLFAAMPKVNDLVLAYTMQSSGISTNEDKGVEVSAVAHEVTPDATHAVAPDATHEVSQVTPLAQHKFNLPRPGPSSSVVSLPIEFVAPVLGQPLGIVRQSSAKKRRKNKRRANKKIRVDNQLSIADIPGNQVPPCSVAQ